MKIRLFWCKSNAIEVPSSTHHPCIQSDWSDPFSSSPPEPVYYTALCPHSERTNLTRNNYYYSHYDWTKRDVVATSKMVGSRSAGNGEESRDSQSCPWDCPSHRTLLHNYTCIFCGRQVHTRGKVQIFILASDATLKSCMLTVVERSLFSSMMPEELNPNQTDQSEAGR